MSTRRPPARAWIPTVLALLVVPVPAAAETVPDIPDLGPYEVVEPSCGTRTEAGCCYREGAATAVAWCAGNLPEARSCNLWFWQGGCGWNAAAGRYDCFGSGADPSGTHPWSCGWDPPCVPDCTDRDCGSDGCGGSCGTCGAGTRCEPAGRCRAGDPCFAYPETSCCDEERAHRCVDGHLEVEDCGRDARPCGWSVAAQRYACGGNGDDPTGVAHRECAPFLTPDPGPEGIPEAAGDAGGDPGLADLPHGTPDGITPPAADARTDAAADARTDTAADADQGDGSAGSCAAGASGTAGASWPLLLSLLPLLPRPGRRPARGKGVRCVRRA